ncbi:uncharacterized protein LOC100278523 [Zea mays]|uniref:Uncharacterized protein n=1 Tax=Zea mays TaxID=4577 RepID=B6UA42_MAIZE|nr:uncharacterized protein LOC100278523 [Zea mays]ACG46225.1 hypothetical protein [Zea mays]|eukprot:NP_001145241.1 uncharacterized protein LOC100278523 [Zea mays]
MHIWFQICASIVSSCQLGRRHVYFHSCAPILASPIVSFWCTADLVCVKCIRLSQVGDFQLCSLRPRRRRRRRSVHRDRLLHGRIDATTRYGYLELAIEQMAETADASNALDHGLHYLRSTGNACAARALLWWGWDNSDAHAELYTQDEVPSLPVTQNSPTTSLAKLSTCSNERNEGDDQHTSELNKQDLSSPPKRYLLFVHLSGSPSLLDHECFPLDMNQLLAYLWIYTYGLNTCKHTVARS